MLFLSIKRWTQRGFGQCTIVDRGASGAATKLLTKDEARRIAANIAKLPELIRLRREAEEDLVTSFRQLPLSVRLAPPRREILHPQV
jgi:hypothetical protein